jgi:peptidoglycan/xylan/chitin deacetylase (PgdA/CDA1 family)
MPPPPPTPSVPTGPSAPLLSSGPTDQRVVAFTIDDDYTEEIVREELAIFQRERVNATFFPVGTAVYAYPDLWKEVARAGFPIGTHTFSHKNLTTLTYDEMVTEIKAGSWAITSVTGVKAVPILRPPWGAWNKTVLVAAHAAGQRAVVLWNTAFDDTGNWSIGHQIAKAEKGRNGSIILLHGNSAQSVNDLPTVIAFYKSCGFRFVTVGQLIGVPGPVPFPDTNGPNGSPSAPATMPYGRLVPAATGPDDSDRFAAAAPDSPAGRRLRRRSHRREARAVALGSGPPVSVGGAPMPWLGRVAHVLEHV